MRPYPAKSRKGVSIYCVPWWLDTPFDAVELALQDIRCGTIKPGETVYVWEPESKLGHGMRTMVAGSFGGGPSLSDIGPAPKGIVAFPFMKRT